MTQLATAPTTCPKCGHRAAQRADACARCGLLFARWSPDSGAAMPTLDARAEELWTAARGRWEDQTAHDAFLKYCSVAAQLAPAGRRYREVLDERPADPIATRMQERIVAMATASFVRPTAPPAPVTRSRWFWGVVLICGVGGSVAALLFGR